jgi:HAD superfamily hydrolase (TIGR01509 family)
MIRALIFDFDGLILDTEGPVFQSWQELYQEFGCVLDLATWADYIGMSPGAIDLYFPLEACLGYPVDRLSLEPQRERRELALISGQSIRPGVLKYLTRARQIGLKIGLASSSPCTWVTGHLERLDLLQFFDVIKAADDVARTKPDPSLYQTVLHCLGIQPDQAIAIEDSPNGILAARRAGLYCLAVPNHLTRQLPLDHANLQIDSLADLPLDALLEFANHVTNSCPR